MIDRSELAARLVDAMNIGFYPPLEQVDFDPGDPVTLTLFGGREKVDGWFAAYFNDDDEEGNGPTFRILGVDGQVWEGRSARSNARAFQLEVPRG